MHLPRTPLLATALSLSVLLSGACGDDDGDAADDTSTTVAGDESTTTTRPSSGLTIVDVVAEPDDEEAVTIANDGDIQADLGGWQLVVGETTLAIPFSTKIEPGEELVVHRGEGESRPEAVYAGVGEPTIEEDEPIELRDAGGSLVVSHEP